MLGKFYIAPTWAVQFKRQLNLTQKQMGPRAPHRALKGTQDKGPEVSYRPLWGPIRLDGTWSGSLTGSWPGTGTQTWPGCGPGQGGEGPSRDTWCLVFGTKDSVLIVIIPPFLASPFDRVQTTLFEDV